MMKAGNNALLLVLLLTWVSFSVQAQGQLWGTTRKGGITGGGTIIKTNADASGYFEVKKEWALNSSGTSPQATLMEASNGRMYGVTPSGGATGGGVLFEFYPGSDFYRALWHFTESYDGSNPLGGLVEASNGKLYGMTTQGGQDYRGSLFEFDPVAGIVSPKFHLTAATGESPRSSMIAASNGKLYGTCASGGSIGWGVLFEYDPASSAYTVKHNFDNTNGTYPYGALIQASNGKFYGTTEKGGSADSGTLFEYDLSSGTFTISSGGICRSSSA